MLLQLILSTFPSQTSCSHHLPVPGGTQANLPEALSLLPLSMKEPDTAAELTFSSCCPARKTTS